MQPIEIIEKIGMAPLHYACNYDKIDILSTLLTAGAKMDTKNLVEETPLHTACYKGNETCVKILVDNKAPLELEASLKVRATQAEGTEHTISAKRSLFFHLLNRRKGQIKNKYSTAIVRATDSLSY